MREKRQKKMITLKKDKHTLFDLNKTWVVEATSNGKKYIMCIDDYNITRALEIVKIHIERIMLSEAKKACNLFVRKG